MTATVLLAREGHKSNVHIGVTKGDGRLLKAHAWVECDGEVLVGGEEARLFKPLTSTRNTAEEEKA